MAKLLVTLPICWMVLNLTAQNTPTSFQESDSHYSTSNTSPKLTLNQLISYEMEKEKEIQIKVKHYEEAEEAERLLLLDEITDLLFEVLDVKIQQKELEITLLDRELNSMQLDTIYAHKKEQIEALKGSINQVEDNLQFRKAHRNAIVLNRLEELGIGYGE